MRKIQIVTTTEIITVDTEDDDVYKWINAIEQQEKFAMREAKEPYNPWSEFVTRDVYTSDIKSYTITMGDDEQ